MRDHAPAPAGRDAAGTGHAPATSERGAPEQVQSPAAAQLFQRTSAGAAVASPPAAPAASAGPPAGGAETGALGVIVDDGLPLGAGQVARTVFFERLASDIERAADDELRPSGYSTSDCPYLAHWLAFYRGRPAAQLERAILRYARPTGGDAADLRGAVVERVRRASRDWLRTGRVSGLPADLRLLGGDDHVPDHGGGRVLAKRESGRSASRLPDAGAVRAHLGAGQPLGVDTRARMQRAFGRGFEGVRVHTDSSAAHLGARLHARALSVGDDVAFAAGQYRPGTLAGDLLLAHELAHTLQQGGAAGTHAREAARGSDAALERQADRAALDAVIGVTPSWTQGGPLALRRCDGRPAPRPAPRVISLAEFIALVRRVEASNPGLNAEAIARRISRTKYAGSSWEWLLPSTASDVAVAAGGSVTAGDVAALSHKLRVTLPGGREADPLHIIVTLVARRETSAPGSGGAGGTLAGLVSSLPASVSQVEAASWVGDVGQAAAEWMTVHPLPRGGGATREDYMTEFAPDSDLLADVDGVAMTSTSAAAGFAFDPARPLSENLERFYSPSAARTGRSRRFHIFCSVQGFTLESDGVTLSGAAQAAIDTRVRDFADWFSRNNPQILLYVAAAARSYHVARALVARAGDWTWFAGKFRDFVQRGLTAEGR